MATAGKLVARSSTQLPHATVSAGLARRFVAVTLHRWGLGAQVEVVALLAGELVTNAVLHTASAAIGLVVRLDDRAVHVGVHDTSSQLPKQDGSVTWDDQSGRGLALVDALATRWGVESAVQGKAVWFEVPAA
jgi:anti-sigma regulatory factor (Ser/Thr protein kinase)